MSEDPPEEGPESGQTSAGGSEGVVGVAASSVPPRPRRALMTIWRELGSRKPVWTGVIGAAGAIRQAIARHNREVVGGLVGMAAALVAIAIATLETPLRITTEPALHTTPPAPPRPTVTVTARPPSPTPSRTPTPSPQPTVRSPSPTIPPSTPPISGPPTVGPTSAPPTRTVSPPPPPVPMSACVVDIRLNRVSVRLLCHQIRRR